MTLHRLGEDGLERQLDGQWQLSIREPSEAHPSGHFSCLACKEAARRAHDPSAWKHERAEELKYSYDEDEEEEEEQGENDESRNWVSEEEESDEDEEEIYADESQLNEEFEAWQGEATLVSLRKHALTRAHIGNAQVGCCLYILLK